jgi:hypothetical protein
VHGLPSSQLTWVPPQAPPEQVSLIVHALLSLQLPVMFVWTQPVPVLHVSDVQTLLSSQFGAAPPTHEPDAHVSFVVHALLSLQAAVLFV